MVAVDWIFGQNENCSCGVLLLFELVFDFSSSMNLFFRLPLPAARLSNAGQLAALLAAMGLNQSSLDSSCCFNKSRDTECDSTTGLKTTCVFEVDVLEDEDPLTRFGLLETDADQPRAWWSRGNLQDTDVNEYQKNEKDFLVLVVSHSTSAQI
ncbi:hypothetical protein GOBAR_AA08378 [Gossypium barbadense]|uniref:Uncharacterized protein n=2 Tax=Gossypium TaxID=3633 RepID=A0ABR0QV33_GOSAR|nr:hypothetical protein PVK06_005142 [Gossypium arboreum]PPS12266.1 hypothetical protein GOBAR_AA08378 [Gossypium barbadense]